MRLNGSPAVLLALLAGCAGGLALPTLWQGAQDPASITGSLVHRMEAGAPFELQELRWGRAFPQGEGGIQVARNIFRFFEPRRMEPRAQGSPPQPPAPVVPPAPTAPTAVREDVTVYSGSEPPEMALEYIGYLGPRHSRVAVLLDRNRKLHVAMEGEVVAQLFRVVHIGHSFLEMGWTEFDGSKPIPLKEPTG